MSDSDRRLRGSSGVAAVPHSFTESSSFLRYISSFTGSTVPYYGYMCTALAESFTTHNREITD